MSHVITILSTDGGVVSAVGGEETRGTYAELKSLSGIPWSRDKACVVVPLLRFSIDLSIVAIRCIFISHRLLDAGEHRWPLGARDDITIGS